MKKIILLLLITVSCSSQKNKYNETFDENKNLVKFENFTVEDKSIVWTMVFDGDSTKVINDLKGNLKLNFTNNVRGNAKDLSLLCKNISIFGKGNFNLDFKIDFKDNKYRVTASNFVFQNTMQFNFGGVSTDVKKFNLEYFFLQKKTNTINRKLQTKTDLKCMDELLTTLFKVKSENTKNNNW